MTTTKQVIEIQLDRSTPLGELQMFFTLVPSLEAGTNVKLICNDTISHSFANTLITTLSQSLKAKAAFDVVLNASTR